MSLVLIACKNNEQAASLKKEKAPKRVENITETQHKDTLKVSLLEIKKKLKAQGYKTFEYIDESTKDTVLMQQYFMVFLKRGPIRDQNEEELTKLEEMHFKHLKRMYNEGFVDISGPFDDDSDIRGITIYNVPTSKMADSLAHLDPMVKTGRLIVEVHPWWVRKGASLR